MRIAVVDDGVSPGGSLRARGEPIPNLSGMHLYSRATAVGIYEREVLSSEKDEAIVVRPRALILATGAHDGTVAFPGNDLPGRHVGACRGPLGRARHRDRRTRCSFWHGVYANAFRQCMEQRVEVVVVPPSATIAAHGRGRITSITVRTSTASGVAPGRSKTKHDVDALLVEARGAPSFELAEQAGASVSFDPGRGGYVPTARRQRPSAPRRARCAGELAGTGTSLAAIAKQAEAVADDVRAFL